MFRKISHFAQFQSHLTKCIRWASRHTPTAGPQRYQYNEDTIFIREAKDRRRNPAIAVAFKFKNRMPPMDKTYAFWLGADDPVESTLEAIRDKIGNEMRIRIKLGMTYDASDEDLRALANGEFKNFDVAILDENGEQLQEINWKEYFSDESKTPASVQIKMQGKNYRVEFNSPFVVWLDLPSTIIVGDDCYPIDVDLVDTSKDKCIYKWYKGLPISDSSRDNNKIEWKLCGEAFSYRVTTDDIGYKLKVSPVFVKSFTNLFWTQSKCVVSFRLNVRQKMAIR